MCRAQHAGVRHRLCSGLPQHDPSRGTSMRDEDPIKAKKRPKEIYEKKCKLLGKITDIGRTRKQAKR